MSARQQDSAAGAGDQEHTQSAKSLILIKTRRDAMSAYMIDVVSMIQNAAHV